MKEKLLSLLEKADEKYLSGQSLAKQLGVTRAAVWKAIALLRKEGFIIEATPNKGYCLSSKNDILTAPGVEKYLHPSTELNSDLNSPLTSERTSPSVSATISDLRIEVKSSVTSTNALLQSRTMESEGLVIAANEQTQGVGRMGRSFYSPQNTGIYFSILLKPPLYGAEATLLTAVAAVSVCRAIEKITNKEPKIKWVNDIYIDGKKICGILTQASFSLENNRAEHVITGIGINIYPPKAGFPSELEDIAGHILDKPEGDFKNRLLGEVLNFFWNMYINFNKKQIAEEYKSYSMVIGKRVTVVSPAEPVDVLVLDIDESCNLVIEYDDGKKARLSSNEIRIKNIT